MNLANEKEFLQAPPPGRYAIEITSTEATKAASSGSNMIKLSGVLTSKGVEGYPFFDNIITEGGKPGASFGKRKLRGLIGDVVDSPNGAEDADIANHLLGKHLYADFTSEQIMDKDPATGEYTKARWDIDPQTRKQVAVNKLVPQRYYQHDVGGGAAEAPAAEAPRESRLPIRDVPPTPALGAQAPGNHAPAAGAVPPWVQNKAPAGEPAGKKGARK